MQLRSVGVFLLVFGILVIIFPDILNILIGILLIFLGANALLLGVITRTNSSENGTKNEDGIRFGPYEIFRNNRKR